MKKSVCLAVISGAALLVVLSIQGFNQHSPVYAAAESKINFSDMNGHWAKDSVKLAVQNGYVEGYEDGTFRPEQQITRAEFAKLIITALKKPVSGKTTGNDWYIPYVNSAVNAGIHSWSDFTTGTWDTPMTRFEMARMSARAIGVSNGDEKKWMYLATQSGLIQGVDDTGDLSVEGTTTRAEAITIIERILSIKAGQTIKADKHAVNRAEVLWHGTNVFTMLPRYFAAKSIGMFDLSKYKWDSADGKYHEEVIEYIAVDNEDPNDPFRNEVDGMVFGFKKYGSGTNTLEYAPAPVKSYSVYSKVKQVLQGGLPNGMYFLAGGNLWTDPIVPEEAMDGKEHGSVESWEEYITKKETLTEILTNKSMMGTPEVEWNIKNNAAPGYRKNVPQEGGSFYWTSAQIFPKGDFYSKSNKIFTLRYSPNIEYISKIGPDSNLYIKFNTDYQVSN